jgi:hypothetical protein
MKTIIAVIFLTMTGFAQTDTVQSLAWMSGHWVNDNGTTQIEETWSQPAGKSLIGWSRTIRNGRLASYEFMIIRRNAAGDIAFIAKPSGQEGGEFPVAEIRDGFVAFENTDHDFPQKISYRLAGRDSLIGRIEGTVNGNYRTIDFPYKRTRLH